MKKLLYSIPATLGYLTLSASVYAATPVKLCPEGNNAGTSPFGNLCRIKAEQLGQYIGIIITIVLGIAVIIALFFLIWGGIKWILSGGDKAAVEGARNTIVAAIIGLAITFLAFFILTVIGQIFGVSLLEFTLPSLTL